MRSQLKKRNFFPHQDLNHDPLKMKASVLPMSYTDPLAADFLKAAPQDPSNRMAHCFMFYGTKILPLICYCSVFTKGLHSWMPFPGHQIIFSGKSLEIWYCQGFPEWYWLVLSCPVFSRIFPILSQTSGPETGSLVKVPPIREVIASLILSCPISNKLKNTHI